MMKFSENLRSILSAVSKFLYSIISYLPLVYSSLWYFHITVFVALNSVKQKFIVTFFDVVKFLPWVSQLVSAVSFYLSFDIILPITIIEIIPLSNIILTFLNFFLPVKVLIQPFSIGE